MDQKFNHSQEAVSKDMSWVRVIITEAPSQKDIGSLWKKIWSEERKFNQYDL